MKPDPITVIKVSDWSPNEILGLREALEAFGFITELETPSPSMRNFLSRKNPSLLNLKFCVVYPRQAWRLS